VKEFLNYVLIELLPFWDKLFLLIAALAWPFAFVVGISVFRKPIKDFIGRIQRVSGNC